jgi:hypothetical protein
MNWRRVVGPVKADELAVLSDQRALRPLHDAGKVVHSQSGQRCDHRQPPISSGIMPISTSHFGIDVDALP